jgi:hypothetical protein
MATLLAMQRTGPRAKDTSVVMNIHVDIGEQIAQMVQLVEIAIHVVPIIPSTRRCLLTVRMEGQKMASDVIAISIIIPARKILDGFAISLRGWTFLLMRSDLAMETFMPLGWNG